VIATHAKNFRFSNFSKKIPSLFFFEARKKSQKNKKKIRKKSQKNKKKIRKKSQKNKKKIRKK